MQPVIEMRKVTKAYRGWLAQLPADQAKRIAHGNAEQMFGGKIE